MTEAVTPPNPADQSDTQRTVPDPTLLTIDALRREIAMMDSLVDARFIATNDLSAERFHRIDEAMGRFEEQRREQKVDTRDAVNAALEAQKEATAKMEKSISDQISALRNNVETSNRALQGNIADLKDRMTILESVKQGMVDQRGERRANQTSTYAIIGLGVTIVLATLTIIAFFGGG